MTLALTRAIPASITRCELTHIAREPIDFQRASRQHQEYETALAALGCTIVRLPPSPALPDSAFVEHIAVVLRAVAVIARPGAPSPRAEGPAMTEVLREYGPLARLHRLACTSRQRRRRWRTAPCCSILPGAIPPSSRRTSASRCTSASRSRRMHS